MKVKELIEILSTLEQDAEVILAADSEGNAHYILDKESIKPCSFQYFEYGEIDIYTPSEYSRQGVVLSP